MSANICLPYKRAFGSGAPARGIPVPLGSSASFLWAEWGKISIKLLRIFKLPFPPANLQTGHGAHHLQKMQCSLGGKSAQSANYLTSSSWLMALGHH